MKALPILTLALAITAAGCGSDSPTPPTDDPGAGNTTTPTTFTLTLRPSNERPNAITGPEASATGTAVITIRITRDPSNNIVSAVADFNVQMQGFPPDSRVNIAHIHPGDLNATGPIDWDTGLLAGEVTLTNGSGSFSKTNVAIAPGPMTKAADIVANPANYYFNVHSSANTGGVLRAQMNNTGQPAPPPGQGEPKPCDPTDPYCTPQ